MNMKRTLIFIALSLLVLSTPACKKKTEVAASDAPQADAQAAALKAQDPAAQTDAAQDPQKKPDAIEEKPMPVPALKGLDPTPIEQIAALSPEEAEVAILKPFNAVSELSPELKALRERAEIGDDRAKEQFANEIFKTRTHTDPNYKDAIRYMSTIRDIQDPDIMAQRGMMEYASAMGNKEKQDAAIQLLKKAADMGHVKTLDMLVHNMAFEMRDYAYNKLKGIYE